MKVASTAFQAKQASQSAGRGGGQGGGRGSRGDGGRGGRGGRANTGVWAWKDVPPPAGSPQTKVVETKTYHWCLNHLACTLHTCEDCCMEAPASKTPNAEALAVAAIADDQGSIFHDVD